MEANSETREAEGERVRFRLSCRGVPNGDLRVETGGVDDTSDDTSCSIEVMLGLAGRRSYDVRGARHVGRMEQRCSAPCQLNAYIQEWNSVEQDDV